MAGSEFMGFFLAVVYKAINLLLFLFFIFVLLQLQMFHRQLVRQKSSVTCFPPGVFNNMGCVVSGDVISRRHVKTCM